MSTQPFPPLPLEEWEGTKQTLHLFSQIVGKAKLAVAPPLNHWWHVPLHVGPSGLETGILPIPAGAVGAEPGAFSMTLDLRDSTWRLERSDGFVRTVPLRDQTVASFYREVRATLAAARIPVRIRARPFDPARVGSDVPFARDDRDRPFDPDAVRRFHRVLLAVDDVLKEFRGRFLGKSSPVHFFWHSFDLAVTRFSGRRAPVAAGADPVSAEAYSHEVISAGFWPGDANVRGPAFYAYAAPEPAGLAARPLSPPRATWVAQNGSHLALFLWEDARAEEDPRSAALDFLQSSYETAAELGGWPRTDLER